MSSKQLVKGFFNGRAGEWAAYYSDPAPRTLNAQSFISRQRFALEMVETSVPRGSKVLDVGCGAGALVAELTRRGYEVWGVDIAEAMIRHVQERFGLDRFQVGDIERIPFPDHTFDAVLCLGVMEYLDTDEPALREMRRVLKIGGTAVISTPSAICPFDHIDRMIRCLVVAARPLCRFVKYRPRSRKYYRGRWLRLLRSVGLEPVEWVCHGWGWYTLDRFFGQAHLCRASDRFARNRLLNWLAHSQLIRVCAVEQ